MTSIEWTDHTWNPIVGCDKIASECDHCYAAWVAAPTREFDRVGNGVADPFRYLKT